MKKIKKACGKGGGGLVNLASAAAKTVVAAPLSQAEKQTLHEFRGDMPAQVIAVQAPVVQPEPHVIYVRSDAVPPSEPPPYDAVIGGDAHNF